MDFIGRDQREGLRERNAQNFDLLVSLGLGNAGADIASQVNLHVLAKEAGAGEVFGKQSPAFGAITGLFDHLAPCGGKRSFAGLDASSGQLEQKLAGGVAVLTLYDDDGSLGLPVSADSSTARITTEPLWRMTSRVFRYPVGSMTVSVKTEKTLPL